VRIIKDCAFYTNSQGMETIIKWRMCGAWD